MFFFVFFLFSCCNFVGNRLISNLVICDAKNASKDVRIPRKRASQLRSENCYHTWKKIMKRTCTCENCEISVTQYNIVNGARNAFYAALSCKSSVRSYISLFFLSFAKRKLCPARTKVNLSLFSMCSRGWLGGFIFRSDKMYFRAYFVLFVF